MKNQCSLLTKIEDDYVSGFIPLTNLTHQDFEKTIRKLENFWKAKSIALLDRFGLHTLSAVAITSWDEKIKQKLVNFCKVNDWNSVVIRTDKKKETGKDIPRGGYLVKISQLDNEIQKYLQNGRIVMILEPRDRYKNLYGVNILYDSKEPENLYLEVVGPGFEVSNLNRGDIIPHERLMVKLKEKLIILDRNIISGSSYRESVDLRYQQIGKRILEENISQNQSKEKLIKIGKGFLKTHGYHLLKENKKSYQKIPEEHLEKIVKNVIRLLHKMAKSGMVVDQFVLSSTVFDSGELVFWDMVFPEHKYEGKKNAH